MAVKVLLDVDTGTDDAVAIMLAAVHPALELTAITTVNGNVPVDHCTENTLRVLDYIGKDNVPVYEGSPTPFARSNFPVPRIHGEVSQVHGNYLDIAAARSRKKAEKAAIFLTEYFAEDCERQGDTVLLATGPLSNIALALKLDPEFAVHVKKLVIMGGGHEISNVTAAAEANIWHDPEAASVVLSSGIQEIILVPLDATHRALISTEDCLRLRALGTPAAEATALFVERRIAAYDASQPMGRRKAAPVHDALCVAFLIDPSVIRIDKYAVSVETRGELTLGRTIIDTHRRSREKPNVWVALDADENKFVEIIVDTFSRVH